MRLDLAEIGYSDVICWDTQLVCACNDKDKYNVNFWQLQIWCVCHMERCALIIVMIARGEILGVGRVRMIHGLWTVRKHFFKEVTFNLSIQEWGQVTKEWEVTGWLQHWEGRKLQVWGQLTQAHENGSSGWVVVVETGKAVYNFAPSHPSLSPENLGLRLAKSKLDWPKAYSWENVKLILGLTFCILLVISH